MNRTDLKLILNKAQKSFIKSLKKTQPFFSKPQKRSIFFSAALTFIFFIWIISYPFISLDVSEENEFFEVKKGANFKQITNQLVTSNVLPDALRFKILAKLTNRTESIKSGHYFLENNISPNELLTLLVKGEGILYPITFIEGTTFEDNFKKIKNNNLLKQEVSYSSDDDLRKILGIHYKDLEGLFFPDTYYFYKGTPDIEILKQSYNLMMQKLNKAWKDKTPGLPYKNKYEALIVASIIEKELGNRDEASLIAGVFVNRLRIGMPLQSDPTVIYGMKDNFKGNLSRKDLMIDTIYNTYTRNGLPPSPICLPGFDTIEAALNPAETNAFYFVAKGDNKTHHFSKTLKEHNEAVRKYQK